jgi:predicted MPP superfamily phosphohydrolase
MALRGYTGPIRIGWEDADPRHSGVCYDYLALPRVRTLPTLAESQGVRNSMEPLFAWVHLSDIHFGHGGPTHGWDQKFVLTELQKDIQSAPGRDVPRPDAIFVTGDLAFSGNVRKTTEYDDVGTWLKDVAKSISVPLDCVFIVPGNHDVQRNIAEDDKNVARLLDALRSGKNTLDTALANPNDRALLVKRCQNYLDFVKGFMPAKADAMVYDDGLFWVYRLPACRPVIIRIIGFNTALLCSDNTDHKKLELGMQQLAQAFLSKPEASHELVIVLSHHPFTWLRDERDVSGLTQRHAHIHLCGHIHEAQTERLQSGGGMDFVRVVAGAAHDEQAPANTPAQHGYNFGAIWVRDDGQLILRVWPRIWSQRNHDFRVDVHNVPNGEAFADHTLRLRLPRPEPDEDATQKLADAQPNHAAGVAPPARVTFDPAKAFLGEDIEAEQGALQAYVDRGDSAVPEVLALLKDIHRNWSKTHRAQVLHRFKTFFATFERVSADPLADLVWEGDWWVGGDATACFDFFTKELRKNNLITCIGCVILCTWSL